MCGKAHVWAVQAGCTDALYGRVTYYKQQHLLQFIHNVLTKVVCNPVYHNAPYCYCCSFSCDNPFLPIP